MTDHRPGKRDERLRQTNGCANRRHGFRIRGRRSSQGGMPVLLVVSCRVTIGHDPDWNQSRQQRHTADQQCNPPQVALSAVDVAGRQRIYRERHAHDCDDDAIHAKHSAVLAMDVQPRLLGSHRLHGLDTGDRIQRQTILAANPPEIKHQRRTDDKKNNDDHQHVPSFYPYLQYSLNREEHTPRIPIATPPFTGSPHTRHTRKPEEPVKQYKSS